MIVSLYNLCYALGIMLLLCCHVPGRKRKWVEWPLNIANIVINCEGLFLVIMTKVTGIADSCNHNELWIFSLVIVTITLSIGLLILMVWLLTKFNVCLRLGRLVFIEEPIYDYAALLLHEDYVSP
jgi:hypothetical protein